MTEDKKIKVEFAPGAFDNFDGTQEELDELIKEIENMFANKTPEELQADAHEMTDEDWDDLPDDAKMQIFRSIMEENDDEEDYKRKLQ